MNHACIKYRLTPEGRVPSFLCLDPDGVGGAFGTPSEGSTQHNKILFIGLANPGAVGDFEVVPTQQDLENYLSVVGANWKILVDPIDPAGPTTPFDPVVAAQWVWDRKIALDAKEFA